MASRRVPVTAGTIFMLLPASDTRVQCSVLTCLIVLPKYLIPLWRLKPVFGYWDLYMNRIPYPISSELIKDI